MDNDNLTKEGVRKQEEIEKLTLSNVRGINTSTSFIKQTSYDQSLYLDNKIRELESTNKQTSQEKQKYEIEWKVLKERYDDVIVKYSNLIKEYTALKKTQLEVFVINVGHECDRKET